MAQCEHVAEANWQVKPADRKCQKCAEQGLNSVELRICLVCGNVACCDSSTGRHATRHFQETGHTIMRPLKGNWAWCYVHEKYLSLEVGQESSRGLAQLYSLIKQLWTSRTGNPTN
jgi:hypothetical protein